MAGANISIDIDPGQIDAALSRANAALGDEGLRLLLMDMGEYLLGATQDRAASETSPDGAAWPALDPRYARRKARKRPGAPMLVWDRHMLGDQLSHQVVGDTLLVGTNAKYGATQQFGAAGRGIPARSWLGISDDDADELGRLVTNHLLAALDGGTP